MSNRKYKKRLLQRLTISTYDKGTGQSNNNKNGHNEKNNKTIQRVNKEIQFLLLYQINVFYVILQKLLKEIG